MYIIDVVRKQSENLNGRMKMNLTRATKTAKTAKTTKTTRPATFEDYAKATRSAYNRFFEEHAPKMPK